MRDTIPLKTLRGTSLLGYPGKNTTKLRSRGVFPGQDTTQVNWKRGWPVPPCIIAELRCGVDRLRVVWWRVLKKTEHGSSRNRPRVVYHRVHKHGGYDYRVWGIGSSVMARANAPASSPQYHQISLEYNAETYIPIPKPQTPRLEPQTLNPKP